MVGTHGTTGRCRREAEPAPGLLRLETNRSLTGMGHEQFTSLQRRCRPDRQRCSPASCSPPARSTRCTCTATSSRSTSPRGSTATASADVVATCTSTGSRGWRCRPSTPRPRKRQHRRPRRPTAVERVESRVHPAGAAIVARAQRRGTGQVAGQPLIPPGVASHRNSRRGSPGRYNECGQRSDPRLIAVTVVPGALPSPEPLPYFFVHRRHGRVGVLGRRRRGDARLRVRRRRPVRSSSCRVDRDPGRSGLLPDRRRLLHAPRARLPQRCLSDVGDIFYVAGYPFIAIGLIMLLQIARHVRRCRRRDRRVHRRHERRCAAVGLLRRADGFDQSLPLFEPADQRCVPGRRSVADRHRRPTGGAPGQAAGAVLDRGRRPAGHCWSPTSATSTSRCTARTPNAIPSIFGWWYELRADRRRAVAPARRRDHCPARSRRPRGCRLGESSCCRS